MVYVRWVITTTGDPVNQLAFTPPLVISGIGLGLGFASLFQMVLAGVPHRDAGSASGVLQAFQQAGGALSVALIGEIFFTWLDHASDWGAASPAEAYGHAAAAADIYVIAVFAATAALVPFLKPAPRPSGPAREEAAPVAVVEG